jgi:hypothetical protein
MTASPDPGTALSAAEIRQGAPLGELLQQAQPAQVKH